jgi:hypothetical protein
MSAPAGPLSVVTFRTPKGQCCFYATRLAILGDGRPAAMQIPPQVRSQLDALGARVAWMWVGPPFEVLLRGEAWQEEKAITAAGSADLDRLCFC